MRRSFLMTLGFAGMLASATAAYAGPPLLCHPYDIGSAKSLPWGGSWSEVDPAYSPAHLIADTEALLTPATPVVVRMETLRRASLYASRDAALAGALVDRFTMKARKASDDPLALLDAAYVIEALKQAAWVHERDAYRGVAPALKALVNGLDGTALVAKSAAARPQDAAFQFAAAMISAGHDKAAYEMYAQRTKAAAAQDPLVARNLGHLN
jgi:hypothetical protein